MHLAIILLGLTCGPLMFFQGTNANNRERASLQWPKTVGTMTDCHVIYLPGVHSTGRKIAATYIYVVNNQRYTGQQVNLSGHFEPKAVGDFVFSHPVSSSVDVYYDPQNPGNAVLIPGADEAFNQYSIIAGCIVFACGIIAVFQLPKAIAQMRQKKVIESL